MKPYKIVINQCSVGRYNLLSNEKYLSFYMSIMTEDKKVYEENGTKAQLYYSGGEDELYDFENALDNLGWVFEKCFKYASRVISSIDYESQCLLFAKVYQENFEELNRNMKEERNKKIEEKIKKLEEELEKEPLSDISFYVESALEKRIKNVKDHLNYWKDKNKDVKEGSETYKDNMSIINSYTNEVEKLENFLKNIKKEEKYEDGLF